MSKLTLTRIENIETSVADINANYDRIEAAIENTLSRDGTTPNHLTAPLDINGQAILNAHSATISGRPYVVPTDFGINPGNVSYTAANTMLRTCADDGLELVWYPERYVFDGPLIFRPNLHMHGSGFGATGTTFAWNYAGPSSPITVSGVYGYNNWIWNLNIHDIYVDAAGYTGTSSYFMLCRNFYSCKFWNFTIDGCRSAYIPLAIGKNNWSQFERFRIDGDAFGGGTRAANILVDSSIGAGPINGLVFRDMDLESSTKGIDIQSNIVSGSTHPVMIRIDELYTEASNTSVYWNASATESGLTYTGGNLLIPNTGTGIDVRKSHVTVLGAHMYSSGSRGVDVSNATTHENIHVLGGHIRTSNPVYDPSNWCETNTYA